MTSEVEQLSSLSTGGREDGGTEAEKEALRLIRSSNGSQVIKETLTNVTTGLLNQHGSVPAKFPSSDLEHGFNKTAVALYDRAAALLATARKALRKTLTPPRNQTSPL